ncbi:hypothetical protein HanRHA438_Chr16g0760031 [Helianthus annuus]|nr:hypothetical protein HanIR_Chr16g0813221 [Helianthus annuus]KAJ0835847.1 hypothetical protein HanRHA438_Chr16g0760031 [Helianthus annuus]
MTLDYEVPETAGQSHLTQDEEEADVTEVCIPQQHGMLSYP